MATPAWMLAASKRLDEQDAKKKKRAGALGSLPKSVKMTSSSLVTNEWAEKASQRLVAKRETMQAPVETDTRPAWMKAAAERLQAEEDEQIAKKEKTMRQRSGAGPRVVSAATTDPTTVIRVEVPIHAQSPPKGQVAAAVVSPTPSKAESRLDAFRESLAAGRSSSPGSRR